MVEDSSNKESYNASQDLVKVNGRDISAFNYRHDKDNIKVSYIVKNAFYDLAEHSDLVIYTVVAFAALNALGAFTSGVIGALVSFLVFILSFTLAPVFVIQWMQRVADPDNRKAFIFEYTERHVAFLIKQFQFILFNVLPILMILVSIIIPFLLIITIPLALIASMFLLPAKLFLVFPAAAFGRNMPFSASWHLTAGYAFKAVISGFLFGIVIGLGGGILLSLISPLALQSPVLGKVWFAVVGAIPSAIMLLGTASMQTRFYCHIVGCETDNAEYSNSEEAAGNETINSQVILDADEAAHNGGLTEDFISLDDDRG